MEKSEFEKMFQLEDEHGWSVGLREIVLYFIAIQRQRNKSMLLLDAGCGTGGLLYALNGNHQVSAVGIDISSDALLFCQKRGLRRLLKASVCDLPFRDEIFDMILSLDVLSTRYVKDDIKALLEFKRVLKPGGEIVINLPAWEFIKGSHDRAVDTRHRYTKSEIIGKLETVGLSVKKISYWNFILFPLIVSKRLAGRFLYNRESCVSEFKRLPKLLNQILRMNFKLEKLILQFLEFPIGLSIICIAEKSGERLYDSV